MLNTQKEIIEACSQGKRIYQLVLEEEQLMTKATEDQVRTKLSEVLKVMKDSAVANLNKATESKYNMIDGFAEKMYAYSKGNKGETLTGQFITEAMAMAFSTSEINCAMGKIVAAPTAGSAGILPAAMTAVWQRYNYDEQTLQNGLLTATAIGQIIGKYATFAGAEGGCQAECGAAAAMAAGALVEMAGGSAEEVLHSASFALIHVLGLVCDPIAGLVQYPCTFRNASGVVNAMISADMAMAGVTSIVPFEEVVQAMGEVGKQMVPELRETGLGGLAGTKTGNAIREDFLSDK